MSLVERALNMLDEIVIAIGVNEAKSQYFSVDERVRMLEDLFRSNPRVKVLSYNCLTVDLARQCHAGFILRGIRSVNDFEYEKTIADVNRKISGVETLVLFTEPEHTHISSTIVRELLRYGRSVDEFLPEGLVLSR
jgi:pantetheine-phosphate adenylyltransferase